MCSVEEDPAAAWHMWAQPGTGVSTLWLPMRIRPAETILELALSNHVSSSGYYLQNTGIWDGKYDTDYLIGQWETEENTFGV